jgi:hypothetical protein
MALHSIPSMLDTLTGLADEVRASAHSVLDVSKIVYNDINRGGGVVVVGWTRGGGRRSPTKTGTCSLL